MSLRAQVGGGTSFQCSTRKILNLFRAPAADSGFPAAKGGWILATPSLRRIGASTTKLTAKRAYQVVAVSEE